MMIPLVKGISQHNILKLLDLRLMYVNKLEVTEFSSLNYLSFFKSNLNRVTIYLFTSSMISLMVLILQSLLVLIL